MSVLCRAALVFAGLLFVGTIVIGTQALFAQASSSESNTHQESGDALRCASTQSASQANPGLWVFGTQISFALENDIPRNISHINLLIAQPQIGLVVKNSSHFPIRHFEILNEGIFGNAVHPGGRFAGYALLFRLAGRSHGRVAPFFDFGGGVQRTTLHHRVPELTGPLQFSPQAGVGLQFFLTPRRALVIEYRYLHMSNANIQPPNDGFNASMLSVGYLWLRRPGGLRPSHQSRHPLRFLLGAK